MVRLGKGRAGTTQQTYFKFTHFEELAAQIDTDLADMAIPAIWESVPVVNTTRRQSERALRVLGLRPEDTAILDPQERIDAEGNLLNFARLGPREVFLNAAAAQDLDATPGDKLELYTGAHPTIAYVRGVAAGGENPRMILPLRRAQTLFNQPGHINVILISNRGNATTGADLSQAVTTHLRGLLTDRLVANRIFDLLNTVNLCTQLARYRVTDYLLLFNLQSAIFNL